MPAPKGNRFWEARSSHGRKPIFSEPERFRAACVEYLEWVEENPLWEAKAFAFQGAVTVEKLPKMRAMTIGGLCLFLGIARSTWDEYKAKEGFSEISREIEEAIRDQKFAGAAADLLNASIIARDLGLAERSEHTGKDGGPIETKELSDQETARRIAFLLAKGLAE